MFRGSARGHDRGINPCSHRCQLLRTKFVRFDTMVHKRPSHCRAGLQRNADFATWLAQLVVGALYSGSPFSRRLMALETMRLMLQVGLSGAGPA